MYPWIEDVSPLRAASGFRSINLNRLALKIIDMKIQGFRHFNSFIKMYFFLHDMNDAGDQLDRDINFKVKFKCNCLSTLIQKFKKPNVILHYVN